MDVGQKEALLKYFKENREEILCDLVRITKKESPTKSYEDIDACFDEIAEIIKERLYIEPFKIERDGHIDLMALYLGFSGKKLLLLGHIDTVWDKGAIPLTIDGNIAKGPGVYDMKYGVISAIWALKAISDLSLPFNKEITLLINSDEEIGSPISRAHIEEEAKDCDAVLVLEPADREGRVTTSRKGVGRYTVDITGRASHAGMAHSEGISAIREGARLVEFFESLTDYESGTTANVGVFSGGTRPNVVSERARLEIDFRVTSQKEADRLEEIMKNLKPSREGIKLDVAGRFTRPPFEKNEKGAELFCAYREIARDFGMDIDDVSCGGGSDGNFTSAMGIATLDGLGPVGFGAHSADEQIFLEESIARTALLCKFIVEY